MIAGERGSLIYFYYCPELSFLGKMKFNFLCLLVEHMFIYNNRQEIISIIRIIIMKLKWGIIYDCGFN
jgi:hypothetical protein